MTNAIAIVFIALVTNVTEHLPQMTVPASPPDSGGISTHAIFYSKTVPAPNPTEKWITTSIVERTTFSVDYGVLGPVQATKERLLTNWTTHFLLVPPPPPAWLPSTNNAPMPMYWPMGGMIR